MPSATVTSKGQVTIPKAVRDALAVRAGDVIDFQQGEDGSFRVHARKVHASSLAGLLHKKGRRRVSLEEMDAAIAEGARRMLSR
ncbi:MAG: AbrB/MazE/SpoVT family DNA-binding domain-containing protein [Thermoanaerobaculia bacterium]